MSDKYQYYKIVSTKKKKRQAIIIFRTLELL